jgi:hypothetical protein
MLHQHSALQEMEGGLQLSEGLGWCPLVITPLRSCRVVGCGQAVPTTLAQEALCLDHYIEQGFARLRAALELCQSAQPVDRRTLDWLLADADFVVHALCQNGRAHTPAQHDKLLELLLGLTNLQDYVRHHSVHVNIG